MTGPWDIKFPPPVFPVRPGDSIQKRKPKARRPRRKPDSEHEQDKPQDDDQQHIDDYA